MPPLPSRLISLSGIVMMLLAALAVASPLPPEEAVAADASTAAGAQTPGQLVAGAGRADITPPTGRFQWGWFESTAVALGQQTRLFARSLVLQQGDRKVALVAADIGAVPGGLAQEIAERLRARGFTTSDVIIAATHTHSGPTGYFTYPYFNRVYPTTETPTELDVAGSIDRQLYGFLIKRIVASVVRADRDRSPAVAGWGHTALNDLTENRSVEAHLANHGIHEAYGEGSASMDPDGVDHTISPAVDVLRVDKLVGGRRVPIGAWSSFAAHATVNPPSFTYYTGDYIAAADRLLEARIRRSAGVPAGQEVVNVYGASDGGDVSAALHRRGPAWAHEVGDRVADRMWTAWRRAGLDLRADLALDSSWTRVCFCGQQVTGGQVSDTPVVGAPQLTGSEEGRGPLYAITGVPLEGTRLPASSGAQGRKAEASRISGEVPQEVPLSVVRIGDRLVVTIPGEISSGMGRRVREAVLEAAEGHDIAGVSIAAYANEYLYYFTTPEEYQEQHYEGGSTLYGTYSANLLSDTLTGLTEGLLAGGTPPAPVDSDPTNGVEPDFTPFPPGAEDGYVLDQPATTRRLQRASFEWRGGPDGLDRPLDKAFVTVQRRTSTGWRAVDDDLGLSMLWEVDDEGRYRARWEAPLTTPTGEHRFVVTANRYRLVSSPFRVRPSARVTPRLRSRTATRAVVRLHYPTARELADLTPRPESVTVGRVTFLVDGRSRVVTSRTGRFVVTFPRGARVRIPAGAARDASGNRNGNAYVVTR